VLLDPADLIVFPRVLVGIRQRAEGTLPGMPGTFTGAPLPTARLPVHWWAAAAWVAGLAAFGWLFGRILALGRWRQRRTHPGIVLAVAFVAGAGYLIMSDTTPGSFLVPHWRVGLPLAALAGVGLGLWCGRAAGASGPGRRLGRAIVAAAETGLLAVLPATAVWQAATAQGWTAAAGGRLVSGVVAVAAAALVAGAAVAPWRPGQGRLLAAPALLAAGYVLTGSGAVALAGAALLELVPAGRRSALEPVQVEAQPEAVLVER
jgi:hypothetical protein